MGVGVGVGVGVRTSSSHLLLPSNKGSSPQSVRHVVSCAMHH